MDSKKERGMGVAGQTGSLMKAWGWGYSHLTVLKTLVFEIDPWEKRWCNVSVFSLVTSVPVTLMWPVKHSIYTMYLFEQLEEDYCWHIHSRKYTLWLGIPFESYCESMYSREVHPCKYMYQGSLFACLCVNTVNTSLSTSLTIHRNKKYTSHYSPRSTLFTIGAQTGFEPFQILRLDLRLSCTQCLHVVP